MNQSQLQANTSIQTQESNIFYYPNYQYPNQCIYYNMPSMNYPQVLPQYFPSQYQQMMQMPCYYVQPTRIDPYMPTNQINPYQIINQPAFMKQEQEDQFKYFQIPPLQQTQIQKIVISNQICPQPVNVKIDQAPSMLNPVEPLEKTEVMVSIKEEQVQNQNMKVYKQRELWTQEEDEKLKELVQLYGEKNWKEISDKLGSKNYSQSYNRWHKHLSPEGQEKLQSLTNQRKFKNYRYWTKQEDEKLKQVVQEFKSKKWSQIAKQLPRWNRRECWKRWYYHLDPSLNKSPWQEYEQWILFLCQNVYGNKWASFKQFLTGRSDKSINNQWECQMRPKIQYFQEKLDNILLSGQINTNIQMPFQVIEQQKYLLDQIMQKQGKEMQSNNFTNQQLQQNNEIQQNLNLKQEEYKQN